MYTVHAKGWTSNLSTIVWNELKLPCCLRWKVANVRQDDIYCQGSCVGCELLITCIAQKKSLTFTIKNYDSEFVHDPKNKRRMNLVDKEKLKTMLKGTSAFNVGIQLADDLLDAGDPSCPLIPTGNVLRMIKHKMDGTKESTIDALLTLKKRYPNEIGSIGLDPFHVFYSTELQKAECDRKKNRIIDATGIGLCLY